MANTIGEKELKRAWPHVSGLELVDKHEGRVINLVAENPSLVPCRFRQGL